MASFSLSAALATAAQRSAGDWFVGSLGFSAAAVSAGFAVYMVAVGPTSRGNGGSGDFKVFAAFDRRARAVASAEDAVPPSAVQASTRLVVRSPGPPTAAVDYTPTGSIGADKANAPPALPGGAKPSAEPVRTLSGFAVHDVFDGKAVIEARNKLTIVEPGSVIEGAGSVLAIRRQGAGWVVETTGGTIGQ